LSHNNSIIESKQALVNEIKDKLERAKSVVVVNYVGLTVEEVTELRNQFRAANAEYRVLKNTMVKRALADLGIEGMDQYLEGPTALAFSYEDPTSGPKVMSDFIKKAKKTEIKCGLLEKEVLTAAGVEALSALPSKEILLMQLLSVLNGPIRGFAVAVNALKEKREENESA